MVRAALAHAPCRNRLVNADDLRGHVGEIQMIAGTKASVILRSIYAMCLLGAASTHVRTLLAHGLFWNYGGVTLFSQVFWTSLTFLDPLATLLLFLKPRVGLLLTVAIIVSDVAHNTWVMLHSAPESWIAWMYYDQVAFLLFVLISVPFVWQGTKPPRVGGKSTLPQVTPS